MRVLSAAIAGLVIACTAAAKPHLLPAVRSGDVVLQTSKSRQSEAIQLATDSPYSHVGIVEVTPRGTYVVEAIGKVSRTPWRAWRLRGEGGKVTIRRPRGLSPKQLSKVLAEADAFLGKPYDARFGWDDDRIYCSELVYKAYLRGAGVEVGKLEKVRDLNISPIEAAVIQRYKVIPWNLELVTPASIARSPAFDTIYSDF